MKLLMLKSLTIASLLSSGLYANSIAFDKKLLNVEKKKIQNILKRKNGISLNSISIILKKDLKQDGWYGYAFDLNLKVNNKNVNQKHFIFSNGNMIAPELVDAKTNSSYKNIMYPDLSFKYFSKEHLIAGNPNAKHTMVLFSDPLCPICVDEVPFIMKAVMDNPKNIALYYYHMPLDMHPTAKVLSKASMIAKELGIKDIDYKVYNTDFSNFYDPYREKDNNKALKKFNEIFKTNITMSQINNKKYEDKLNNDLDMAEEAFVNGTPTIFFDGEIDKTRTKYEKYLK
ncbi:MAG: thioredoxin domain-containing protein [Campylobacterota bacterium]|nr:thioredoxin domain-containing protein [Campylobacterota bacterium]